MSIEVKLNHVLSLLQESYKLSVKNEYEAIEENLLSSIVTIKSILDSDLQNIEGANIMQTYKDTKDRTKFVINYKLTDNFSRELPKTRVPENVFKYLIENNLLNDEHYSFFQTNHFRVDQFSSFTKIAGDLITQGDSIPSKEQRRFYEFVIDGKRYYICNQWNRPSIDNFNAYINNNFGDYIEIQEVN